MRNLAFFPLILSLVWPIGINAQVMRTVQIRALGPGPAPQSVTVRTPKADTPIPLLHDGNLFYRDVPAGSEYWIELHYYEDGSHHLQSGWDVIRIRYMIQPGTDAFYREVTRDYPVGCNRPELNRLTSSTDAQAWGSALRGRLMLLQRDKNGCDASDDDKSFRESVKVAYQKLCSRVRSGDPSFLGLQ
jgi:hypothetical protein